VEAGVAVSFLDTPRLVLVLAFGRVAQFSQSPVERRQPERVVALHAEVAAHERMPADDVRVEHGVAGGTELLERGVDVDGGSGRFRNPSE
jgi:hypothetical protein